MANINLEYFLNDCVDDWVQIEKHQYDELQKHLNGNAYHDLVSCWISVNGDTVLGRIFNKNGDIYFKHRTLLDHGVRACAIGRFD